MTVTTNGAAILRAPWWEEDRDLYRHFSGVLWCQQNIPHCYIAYRQQPVMKARRRKKKEKRHAQEERTHIGVHKEEKRGSKQAKLSAGRRCLSKETRSINKK